WSAPPARLPLLAFALRAALPISGPTCRWASKGELPRAARRSVLLAELVHAACGVDDLLLAGIERMAEDRRHRRPRGQVPQEEDRSEEHTSELQSPCNLVCRLLLE